METQIGIILAVMVFAYALAKWRKLSIELSMLFAAVAGGDNERMIDAVAPFVDYLIICIFPLSGQRKTK